MGDLENLPLSYNTWSEEMMQSIGVEYDHDALMLAALKGHIKAQFAIRMKIECAVQPYHDKSVLERIECILRFWEAILDAKANVEWGVNERYIARAIIEIIMAGAYYDNKTPIPSHYDVGCNAITRVVNLDEKWQAVYLEEFKTNFKRHSKT